MNAFDIAVDLSLVPMNINGKILHASYSQKIAQYLACGLPIVAWDVVDNHFIHKENIGALAIPEDVESLFKAFEQLLEMKDEERKELSHRARKYAEKYLSIGKLTEQRLDMWRSSVKNLN